MIQLQGISKVYNMGEVDVTALSGIDIRVDRREFISVMGPSGSGKSTLLHLLGALDSPTSGTYLLEGENIGDLDDREMSRIRNRHFGFIFQSYNLFSELTAFENVMVPMTYGGVRSAEKKSRGDELLASVGMSHRMHHFPGQLSGGEQQRVAIARALANRPTLLLADEPTGNLASKQGREILEILRGLNDEGMTIVMVTHDPLVGSYAKRLIALKDGSIFTDEPIEDRFRPLAVDVFQDDETA